jgi:ureidoacrylate peracid hydrolase
LTQPITIVLKETALVVVDMQNGFCDPNGSMAKSKLAYEQQNRIIPTVCELVSLCHETGVQVMFSLQRHYPNDVTRGRRKIPTHLQKLGVNVCTKGTWDAELVDQLKELVRPEDDVFEKHRSSCFYNTTLESKLKVQGITTLIVCGVATNYCVESTIRDAYARDYDIILIEDAAASLWEDLHCATLKNVELMYGVVMSLATLKRTLKGQTEALAA